MLPEHPRFFPGTNEARTHLKGILITISEDGNGWCYSSQKTWEHTSVFVNTVLEEPKVLQLSML